jgi:hypothetical protein
VDPIASRKQQWRPAGTQTQQTPRPHAAAPTAAMQALLTQSCIENNSGVRACCMSHSPRRPSDLLSLQQLQHCKLASDCKQQQWSALFHPAASMSCQHVVPTCASAACAEPHLLQNPLRGWHQHHHCIRNNGKQQRARYCPQHAVALLGRLGCCDCCCMDA